MAGLLTGVALTAENSTPDNYSWVVSIIASGLLNLMARMGWQWYLMVWLRGPPTFKLPVHNSVRWVMGYPRFLVVGVLWAARATFGRVQSAWYFSVPFLLCTLALLATEIAEDCLTHALRRCFAVPWDRHAEHYAALRALSLYNVDLIEGPSYEYRKMPFYLHLAAVASAMFTASFAMMAVLGPSYAMGLSLQDRKVDRYLLILVPSSNCTNRGFLEQLLVD